MTEDPGLAANLAALDAEVRAAIAATEAGRVVDVTALDAAVRSLCAEATQVERGQRGAVKSGLAELEQNLGRLASAIRARMLTQAEGCETAPPGQAAAAYRKPQGEH